MLIAKEETFGPVASSTASRAKPTRSTWPTTPNSASPPISTDATSAASGASPRRSNTASSASTRHYLDRDRANGREGSKYGIEEFLEVKYLCMAGTDR
jgi:succinate-semialdehyde dehydrogenase/glutarate-semialdehyde dehydrogenase